MVRQTPILGGDESQDLALSVSREYDVLARLLGLPQRENLPNADIRRVVETLANNIAETRTDVESVDGLRDAMYAEYQEHEKRGVANGDTSESTKGAREAEALLNVIWDNYGTNEINRRFNATALSIIPINPGSPNAFDTKQWRINNIPIPAIVGAPPVLYDVIINLDADNAAWQGTWQQVRQNVVGRQASEVGTVLAQPAGAPPPPALDIQITDPVFAAITGAAGANTVVDTRVSMDVTRVPDVPARGQTSSIDLPSMIRRNPEVARMNRNQLVSYLDGSTGGAQGRTAFRWLVRGPNNAALATSAIPAIVDGLFTENSRNPGLPIASTTMSLEDAITRRDPLAMLMTDTVDSRELALALATLQKHPDAIAILQQGGRSQELQQERQRLDREKALSRVVAQLEGLRPPDTARTSTDIRNDIADVRANMATAPAAGLDKMLEKLDNELQNLESTVEAANQLIITVREIPSLAPLLAAGGALHFWSAAPIDEAAVLNNAHPFRPRSIAQQVRAFFDRTQADDKSPTLAKVEDYDQRIQKNYEQSQETQQDTGVRGSDACWAIIKRGLERDGLRGTQLEAAYNKMRERVKESPDAQREAEALADMSMTTEGVSQKEVSKEWNKDRDPETILSLPRNAAAASAGTLGGVAVASFYGAQAAQWLGVSGFAAAATPWLMGLGVGVTGYYAGKHILKAILPNSRLDALRTYKAGILRPLKVKLTDNPYKMKDINQLRRAYFTLKYLRDTIEPQNLRLPDDWQELNVFLHDAHAAILKRTKDNVARSNSDPQMQAMIADYLKKDPAEVAKLNATEKIEALNAVMNGDSYYKRPGVEDMIKRLAQNAYAPIQKKVDAGKNRDELMSNAKWFVPRQLAVWGKPTWKRPLTRIWDIGARKIVKGGLYDGVIKGGVGGTASAVNRNKKGLLGGALIGAAAAGFTPAALITAPIGGLVGAWVANKEKKNGGNVPASKAA